MVEVSRFRGSSRCIGARLVVRLPNAFLSAHRGAATQQPSVHINLVANILSHFLIFVSTYYVLLSVVLLVAAAVQHFLLLLDTRSYFSLRVLLPFSRVAHVATFHTRLLCGDTGGVI